MALRIKQRKIDELKPYEKNARVHTEEQVRQIARSIEVFGMNVPILIDASDGVIAGHGRLEALIYLKHKTTPTIELAHLSDEQKRAYIIADNKIGDNSYYDDVMLLEELTEIHDSVDLDIDLELTGFSMDEFLELEINVEKYQNEDFEPPEPTIAPVELMNECWKQWAGEVYRQISVMIEHTPFSIMGVTKGYARSEFLRALYDGKDYPRLCSHAFHPHQITVPGSLASPYDGLKHTETGKYKTERLRFSMNEKMSARRLAAGGLPFAGARIAPDWPASLARTLMNEYAEGGSVLDPCSGWGGRLVGFLLSDAKSYTGIDCAENVWKGTSEIFEEFRGYVDPEKRADLHCSAYEDWEPTGSEYDFAVTSPPYFDIEKYQGGDQSHSRYANYEKWRDGFYTELIEKTYSLLRDGGVFALQIGSQKYPLLNDGRAIAENVGFIVEAIRESGMVNNFCETSNIDGEVVMILRK